jgi:hypothetical protein
MKPFIFTSSTRTRMLIRDYVQDLNQEMNFEKIVQHFYLVIKNISANINTNDKKLIHLISEVHTETQLKEIIEINLKRLNIKFSNIQNEVVSGNSYDILKDPDGDPGILDWIKDLLGIGQDVDDIYIDPGKQAELDRIMDKMNK